MVLIRLFLNEIILILIIKLKLKITEKKLFAIECENLEHTKAAKDKLQQELDDVANGAQSMIKGCIVEAKAYRLYDINGNFLVDCGTNSRAARVQKLLKEGKINLDMVMTVFSSEDGKGKVAANKVTNDDFN